MRMTKQQLRRIVREAVRSKLEQLDEAPENTVSVGAELGEFLVAALSDEMQHNDVQDDITSNAWERMMGTLGEDNVPVPGRVEDVDAWAELITEHVLQHPETRAVFKTMAEVLLENVMMNFGDEFKS